MKRMANKIFDYMVVRKVHTESVREQYVYGLEVLIGKFACYSTLLFLAILLEELAPTITFMLTFYTLRSRTGGYHAKTFSGCYVATISIYFLLVFAIIPSILGNLFIIIFITVISAVIIMFFSPVDHPNLQLSEEEKIICKESLRWLLLLIIISIGFIASINVYSIILASVVTGISMNAVLIIVEKLYRGGEKK